MNTNNYPRISISQKLARVLLLMAVLTLSVATISLSLREFDALHESLSKKLTLTADMIGQNSSVALLFDDKQTAREILNALIHDPDITKAVIHTPAGEIFAEYSQPDSEWSAWWPEQIPKTRQITRTITHAGGSPVGRITLTASLSQAYQALLRNAAMNASIVLLALCLAVLLVLRLQRTLLRPILQLATLAREIERGHNYSLRATINGNDEVGDLAEAFNNMLAQIQANEASLESQVKTRTRQLETAKREAETANEAKGRFLANMSHEIRTPMNAVIGLVELCLNTPLTAKQREYLQRVETASRSLMAIINDILDFSKMEAGKMQLEQVPFLLEEMLDQVFATMSQLAAAKGIQLIHPPSGRYHAVIGDPQRLQQVLINLVGNAIKFTEHGEVRVQYEEISRDSQKTRLLFTISDTGIGMSEEQQALLFESFSQGDSSITRNYGGTGLGLVISKQLIEQMHGDISVSSRENAGSTFVFTVALGVSDLASIFYAEQKQPRRLENGSLAVLRGARILLVEDNEVNRLVAMELLEQAHLQVDIAENGAVALAKLETQTYACVLMDVQMPVMDGYQATRLLKQLEHCKALPVIAMTANVLEENRRKCLEAGMVDFIGKPILPSALYAVLLKWVKPEPR